MESIAQPALVMDFLADLANLCNGWLQADGYVVPPTTGPVMGRQELNVLYRYFNLQRRRPPAVPRRVHRAREFKCPPQLSNGLAQVECELHDGSDLLPRLSRRLLNPKQNDNPQKNDHLLADWDIHHLHLGLENERLPNGLIKGTKEVLFCILDVADAYLIQVLDHHAFSEPELLEIVYKNWPQLLTPLPLYSGGSLPTRETVYDARKSGVLALVTLGNGIVVAPRGGGYSTTGHSMHAMQFATDWADITNRWECCVQEELPRLVRSARDRGLHELTSVRVELVMDECSWLAVCWELEVVIRLPSPPSGLRPEGSPHFSLM